MRLNCVYLAHSFVIVSVVPQLVLSASGWTKSLLLIQQDLDSEESIQESAVSWILRCILLYNMDNPPSLLSLIYQYRSMHYFVSQKDDATSQTRLTSQTFVLQPMIDTYTQYVHYPVHTGIDETRFQLALGSSVRNVHIEEKIAGHKKTIRALTIRTLPTTKTKKHYPASCYQRKSCSRLPNNLHTKTNIWATQLEHYIDSTISDHGRAIILLHYI